MCFNLPTKHIHCNSLPNGIELSEDFIFLLITLYSCCTCKNISNSEGLNFKILQWTYISGKSLTYTTAQDFDKVIYRFPYNASKQNTGIHKNMQKGVHICHVS